MDVERLLKRIEETETVRAHGSVRALVGLSIRASIPGARKGDLVEILRQNAPPLLGQIVGFHGNEATLLPFGDSAGVGPDDSVRSLGRPASLLCSEGLLGRVLNGLGQPLDGGPPLMGERWSIRRPPPNPLTRPRITSPLSIGIRAIDGLLSIGEGQRIGLFAGSGVGKSTLLGQIARQAQADIFVIALIGERGREVREFLEESLGNEGLKRGVIVCATSDQPALIRLQSAHVATSIAEWFRDQGKRVLLLMDSVTRFARAGREVGLAAGEPPTRRGYPPSVFAELPQLLERSGQSPHGSITAFYTVLVEGDDLDEPIADEVRGILDGHIVLRRELGARGRWPAIDILQSLSRVMDSIVSESHRQAAKTLRAYLSIYEEKRDLVTLGAYQKGSDSRLDAALKHIDHIEAFLRQERTEQSDFHHIVEHLQEILAKG